MKQIFITVLVLMTCSVYGQTDTLDTDWKLYPPKEVKATLSDSIVYISKTKQFKAVDDSSRYFNPSLDLEANGKTGIVRVKKDARIDELLEFLGTAEAPDPVKIDGFRVQVFFDPNRDLALGEKAKFMSSVPNVDAYMEWDAPNHYVRVGNFYTKQQALMLIEDLKGAFPTATVIKCKIELPELPEDELED